jgi:hypothetical protein
MFYKPIILSGQSTPDPVQMQLYNADILAWMSCLSLTLTVSSSDPRDLQCSPDVAEIVVPGEVPGS